MTLSSTSPVVVYQGDGITITFPFSFPVNDVTDLVVSVTTGDIAAAVPLGQFTTTTAFPAPNGGAISYAGLSIGSTLTIRRLVPYAQSTSIINQGGFYPDVLEGALDYLTMECQQLAEQAARSVQVPVGSGIDPNSYLQTITSATAATAQNMLAAATAAAAATTDAETAQACVSAAIASALSVAATAASIAGSGHVGTFTASSAGSTTLTVTDPVNAATPWQVQLFRGGIQQRPGTDFTANGTNVLNLTTAIANGESFWWVHSGGYSAIASNVLPTIAALRAQSTPQPVFFVAGYSTANDGGEGAFCYVASDTTSADNGGTIIVDASGHRYYRSVQGQMVTPTQFGATGNCRTVTDGAMMSQSTILTSATAAFTAADVGKAVSVLGAGPIAKTFRASAAVSSAQFTGSIAGATLTVSNVTSGTVLAGSSLNISNASHIPFYVLSGSGTTWTVGVIQNVPAAPMMSNGAATFVGSISGTTLTVSNVTGTIAIGQSVCQSFNEPGGPIPVGVTITGGSGTTWTISSSLTIATAVMTAYASGSTNTTFTGTIVNNTLTVSNVVGTIAVGQLLSGPTYQGTYIASGTGTVWTLGVLGLWASTPMSTSGNILTVSSVATGTLALGDMLSGFGGGPSGTYITALVTGSGGAGLYQINNAFTQSSETMVVAGPLNTTISGFSGSTQVTLAAISSSRISSAGVSVGTDDTAALQAWLNWINRGEGGYIGYVPENAGFMGAGRYKITTGLIATPNGGGFNMPNIETAGQNAVVIDAWAITATNGPAIDLLGGSPGQGGNRWGPLMLDGGSVANGAVGFRSSGLGLYMLDGWSFTNFNIATELFNAGSNFTEQFKVNRAEIYGCVIALNYNTQPQATFTGSISGTTLTVSGVTGNLTGGEILTGPSIPVGTKIVSGSGSTWTINTSLSVGSEAMAAYFLSSFRSSGLTGNCAIGLNPNSTVVNITEFSECYFCVAEFTVWGNYLWFNNLDYGAGDNQATFIGQITLEGNPAGPVAIGNPVFFSGDLLFNGLDQSAYSYLPITMGSLVHVLDFTYYNYGSITYTPVPQHYTKWVNSGGSVTVSPFSPGALARLSGGFLVTVTVFGTNGYAYSELFWVLDQLYNGVFQVVKLSNGNTIDPNGWGGFTVSAAPGYELTISNSGWGFQPLFIYMNVMPFGASGISGVI